jgi:hypothetical protein
MRGLFQATDPNVEDASSDLSPEATAGFIVAFCVLGFAVAMAYAYTAVVSGRASALDARLAALEAHPRLNKAED